jgi:hypothetical protein
MTSSAPAALDMVTAGSWAVGTTWKPFLLPFFCLAFPLLAGDTIMFFVPSGEMIGPFQRVGATICNQTTQSIQQTGADFMRDTAAAGIQPATSAELLLAGESRDKRSWQRTALLGIEIAGWAITTLTASQLIQIKEKAVNASIAVTSGALRLATTMIQPTKFELPANMRPPIVVLAPGECREYGFYATMTKR